MKASPPGAAQWGSTLSCLFLLGMPAQTTVIYHTSFLNMGGQGTLLKVESHDHRLCLADACFASKAFQLMYMHAC